MKLGSITTHLLCVVRLNSWQALILAALDKVRRSRESGAGDVSPVETRHWLGRLVSQNRDILSSYS